MLLGNVKIMIDIAIHYGNKAFKLLGWLMVLHILYRHHFKGEMPSNWKLFLLIVFLT